MQWFLRCNFLTFWEKQSILRTFVLVYRMICVFLGASSSLLIAESLECALWSFDFIYVCNVLLLSHFCIILVLCSFSCDDWPCLGFQWNLAYKLMIDLPWMSECLSLFLTDAFGSPLEKLFFLCPKFLVFTVLVRLIGYVGAVCVMSWNLGSW